MFHDRFQGPTLDRDLWLDHYLPHWTTPERSAARYGLRHDGLELRIDHDQPAWRPEDGPMRVSGLQTGSFAGPMGSERGQHRHRQDGLTVRSPTPSRRLWTPTYGRVEVAVSACARPDCMVGIWLVGFEEDAPTQAGEICIAEIFGRQIGPRASVLRLGIKAHHDPELSTDMADLRLPFDATARHDYAAEWDEDGVRLSLDGRLVWRSRQRIGYPMQLMVDLFEFPEVEERDRAAYPKTAVVHAVRGWSPSAAPAGPGWR